MLRVLRATSVLATLLALGCAGPRTSTSAPRERSEPPSNVLRRDYVGSEACAGCHRQIFEVWRRSPMHRMTRDVSRTDVAAPFDGRTLRLGQDSASLELEQERPFLRLRQGARESLYRLTKVIGGRYREDFVGELVSPAAPLGSALGLQQVMPISFLRFDGTLRYKGYSVMVPERERLEPGLVWQRACILCHNTAPQLLALYDELRGEGAQSYQGSASNELPPARSVRYVIDDQGGLRAALEAELHLLGASGDLPDDPRHFLDVAISNTRERLTEQALIELGVGCESCHGGARAHVEAPLRFKTSFGARSEFMHVASANGEPLTPAQEQSRSCAKCHTVLFSQYPYTWEGGERRRDPGGSTTNSGEARDFLLGGCASAMSCSSCHDPHGGGSRARLDELMTPRGNGVCTSCHADLARPAALAAHAHHSPSGRGGACLSCHMPKKNMGLAYDFTAYHRIGSPTDSERVERDRPPECAICHADRSVEQLVMTMEKWWGKRYDRARLTELYGRDLRKNAVRLSLLGGKPHERALAADIAARHDVDDTLESSVDLLGSDYPLLRYFAKASLERRAGRPLPLDMSSSGPELVKQGREALVPLR